MFSSALFYERVSALCRKQSTCITLFAKNVLRTSTSAPTNWKNGTVPSADVICRCAEALHVSADYLLGLTDIPTPVSPDAFTQKEASLVKLLRESDPKAREMALVSMVAILRSYPQEDSL